VRNENVAVAEEDGRVIFLHKIIPGGADRSYGVHVAELAGLPKAVVQRARDVLAALERSADGRGRVPAPAAQLPLAPPTPRALAELAALDVDALTPLEAIEKLYELREQARSTDGGTD